MSYGKSIATGNMCAFTLTRHRRREVLSLFHASARPSVCPAVCLHVGPERRCRPNSLRISAIGLKFGGMVHSTVKQITV